jgi:predicted hydrocarbon binding protein
MKPSVPSPELISRLAGDMSQYQERLVRSPGVGQVSLAGVSHALVPTRVMGQELPRELTEMIGENLAPVVMYRLGYLIARNQAKAFYLDRQIDASEVEYRVMAGAFHIAWAGYADADLLIWEPEPNEDFLVLWESDNSYCAREAIKAGVRGRACHLLAGYATGWATEATGIPLETSEIACRAEGVSHCRFLVAHRDRIQQRLLDPRMHRPTSRYNAVSTRTPDVPAST